MLKPEPTRKRSLAKPAALARLVEVLREEVSRLGGGVPLGSEEQMMARYRVSRDTFRRAAIILQQEKLLTVKRGPRGGYFTRFPDEEGVVQVVGVYLASRGATYQGLVESSRALRVELALCACRSQDGVLREQLRRFVEEEKSGALAASVEEAINRHRDFHALIEGLAHNVIIGLFMKTLFSLFANPGMVSITKIIAADIERIEQIRQLRIELGEAILNHDEAATMFHASRSTDLVTRWYHEHLSARSARGKRRNAPALVPADRDASVLLLT